MGENVADFAGAGHGAWSHGTALLQDEAFSKAFPDLGLL